MNRKPVVATCCHRKACSAVLCVYETRQYGFYINLCIAIIVKQTGIHQCQKCESPLTQQLAWKEQYQSSQTRIEQALS